MNAPVTFHDGRVTLYLGDCLLVLPTLAENSVDSIVTDPPYGLAFMGKDWDHGVPGVHFWAEMLRVLKPGGHLVAFGGTRTSHRMVCAIEDAGFEVRDTLMWLYGSGFPKSKNVALGIDKGEGFPNRGHRVAHASRHHPDGTLEPNGEALPPYEGKTERSAPWQGWGTALKPAFEPIVLARKPLSEPTVAANVLRWGTGALNIDGCRVETQHPRPDRIKIGGDSNGIYGDGLNNSRAVEDTMRGRWPANVVHDGSDEVVGMFPTAPGQQRRVGPEHGAKKSVNTYGDYGPREGFEPRGDTGSAARFFYSSKASKADRAGSKHPTVKPVTLMRWLARLVTPPGGVILDPFAGSGTTGAAALAEGFNAILIEREAEYVADIERRLAEPIETGAPDDATPAPKQEALL